MKTLHLAIITATAIAIMGIIFFVVILPSMQHQTTGNVEIQNIQMQPATIKVGNTFTVSATLVNNLRNTVYVNVSPCRNTISVLFDSHVTVEAKNIVCEAKLGIHSVNPGEKFIISYPDYENDFRATTSGTTNATMVFYYFEKDPMSGSVQLNHEKTISKSFSFTIYPEKMISQYALNDTQTAIAVNLAKNSSQFQSLVHGYNYKFDGVFGYLHATSQNDFEVITYIVDFSRYKGPIIPFEPERLITVYENPALTQVFNMTSEDRGWFGGPGGPNIPLEVGKLCGHSPACYLREFSVPPELVSLCSNLSSCYVVGSNGYAMHMGAQSIFNDNKAQQITSPNLTQYLSNHGYAIVPSHTTEWFLFSNHNILNYSDIIFTGNIISKNILNVTSFYTVGNITSTIHGSMEQGTYYITGPPYKKINYTLNLDQYTVNVDEFLKNPQSSNNMTIREPIIDPTWHSDHLGPKFNVGDHVLFYVKNLDDSNVYSQNSFIIPNTCNAKDVLTQNRYAGSDFTMTQNGVKADYGKSGNIPVFTADKPIQFMYSDRVDTLSGKDLVIKYDLWKDPPNKIILSKEINGSSKKCEWMESTKWELSLESGSYYSDTSVKNDDGTFRQTYRVSFSVNPDATNTSLSSSNPNP